MKFLAILILSGTILSGCNSALQDYVRVPLKNVNPDIPLDYRADADSPTISSGSVQATSTTMGMKATIRPVLRGMTGTTMSAKVGLTAVMN